MCLKLSTVPEILMNLNRDVLNLVSTVTSSFFACIFLKDNCRTLKQIVGKYL